MIKIFQINFFINILLETLLEKQIFGAEYFTKLNLGFKLKLNGKMTKVKN